MKEEVKLINRTIEYLAERKAISVEDVTDEMVRLELARMVVKNCSIPDVEKSLPTDSEIEEMANEIPVFPPLNVAKEHRAKWIQGAKALRDLIKNYD